MQEKSPKIAKQIKIDETDSKILRSLLKDARTTFTEIAQNCQISVGAVKARYDRLKKEGVIVGEILQVNPRVIGYNSVADLGIATAVEDEENVLEFLREKPYIPSFGVGAFWKFNIGAFIVLKDIEKLAYIQEEIEAHPLIKHLDPLIWVEAVNMDHTENLVINNFNPEKEHKLTSKETITNPTNAEIDEIDRKIARILARNARMPFKQIAEQLGISTKNVIQRYHRLRGNLLTLSTVTVDLKKLGYNAVVNVLIKASKRSDIPKIHTQILEIPNAIVTIRLIGAYDLRAIFALKDFDDMFQLRQQINRIKGIEQADTYAHGPFREWPLNLFAPLL